jgi:hypothetical protein
MNNEFIWTHELNSIHFDFYTPTHMLCPLPDQRLQLNKQQMYLRNHRYTSQLLFHLWHWKHRVDNMALFPLQYLCLMFRNIAQSRPYKINDKLQLDYYLRNTKQGSQSIQFYIMIDKPNRVIG